MKLNVSGITKSFGEKLVLDDISFEASNGTAFGLLGRNGAGKTTSLRIIMGVFPPDSGEIIIDGERRTGSRAKVGYLPEERGLYPKKPILAQMVYLGELRGMKSSDAKKSALRWLERLEMSEYANKRLDTLSKGNQQKIQLGATLLTDPDIVILDEPFSGLDPVNSLMLKDIVLDLVKEGKCVIFSSHQMGHIDDLCREIAIINGGKIVVGGNLQKIKRSYARDRVIVKMEDEHVPAAKEMYADKFKDIIAEISSSEYHVDIKLTSPDKKTELLRGISECGYDIDGFDVYEPSLNDIFIKYTGGGETEL